MRQLTQIAPLSCFLCDILQTQPNAMSSGLLREKQLPAGESLLCRRASAGRPVLTPAGVRSAHVRSLLRRRPMLEEEEEVPARAQLHPGAAVRTLNAKAAEWTGVIWTVGCVEYVVYAARSEPWLSSSRSSRENAHISVVPCEYVTYCTPPRGACGDAAAHLSKRITFNSEEEALC